MSTEIAWIPGHMNAEGNDKTDNAAKEAALSKGNNRLCTPRKGILAIELRTDRQVYAYKIMCCYHTFSFINQVLPSEIV